MFKYHQKITNPGDQKFFRHILNKLSLKLPCLHEHGGIGSTKRFGILEEISDLLYIYAFCYAIKAELFREIIPLYPRHPES